jgi:hypothetical protein
LTLPVKTEALWQQQQHQACRWRCLLSHAAMTVPWSLCMCPAGKLHGRLRCLHVLMWASFSAAALLPLLFHAVMVCYVACVL